MELIMQTAFSTCGQAYIAMIAEKSVEEQDIIESEGKYVFQIIME